MNERHFTLKLHLKLSNYDVHVKYILLTTMTLQQKLKIGVNKWSCVNFVYTKFIIYQIFMLCFISEVFSIQKLWKGRSFAWIGYTCTVYTLVILTA